MHEIKPLLRFLGMRPTGDLGPLTIYTNKRGRMTSFPKSPPLSPPSNLQHAQRNRFRLVGELWQTLPLEKRREWQTVADRASLYCTGFNLFLYYQICRDRLAIRTLERQTGIPLNPDEPIP